MNELDYVRSALISASEMPDEGFTDRQIHQNRSRHFVESLAEVFRQRFKDDQGVRVLSRGCEDHRLEFGLNELLYDILVCEIDHTKSPRHKKVLTFVSRAIWQIESEFAADAREALFDFNKLVLGSASHKLFIGPKTNDDMRFLESLLPAARCCSGEVFVALATHPAKWSSDVDVAFWRTGGDGWVPVQPSTFQAA
jgi:hypothetical protein